MRLTRTSWRFIRTPKLDGLWWRPVLFVAIPLIVIYVTTLIEKNTILLQSGYSQASKDFARIWLAPANEESWKLFPAVIVGAVVSGALTSLSKVKEEDLPKRTKAILLDHPGFRSFASKTLRHRNEVTFVAAFLMFLYTAERIALYEINGGTLDGGQLDQNEAILKVIGHASFSLLAVPIGIEASRRTPIFILIGYGYRMALSVAITYLTDPLERVAYGAILFAAFIPGLLLYIWWVSQYWHSASSAGLPSKASEPLP